jgi:hypothetical protein
MTITITPAILETLTWDHDEEDIRSAYSGRSMYGRTCLGYEGADVAMFVFHLAVALVRADLEENEDDSEPDVASVELMLRQIGEGRTDSMGRGMITYWPRIAVSE